MSDARECVCVYAPYAGGGHARYAWELATAMARYPRAAYRIELVSSSDLEEPFRSAAYPVHAMLPPLRERREFRAPLSWAASRLLHYPRRELQFLRWLRGRPDVVAVHLQEWRPWLAAPLLRRIRAMGKKAFYTVHNVRPHRYPAGVPKRLMDHWIRRASLLCDGLFVHSEHLADELAQFLGASHPPITVVPHGVWTVPDADNVPALAERLPLKRLLFFGAIRQNKGLDLLLDAAAQHLPGYRITVAGEPVEPDYFQSRIMPRIRTLRAAGVQVNLVDRFVPDDQVGALFAAHSAIVLPYTQAFVAQSGVVFMALAYGLPVVASTAGGLRDLLGEYPIGTTFETGSAHALALAVEALHATTRQEELERQINAARRRFTWHAAAGATLAAYSAAPEALAEEHDCVLGTTPAH